MRCEHNGTCHETLHWKYFVRCEICGKWRLRTKRELFWKVVKSRWIVSDPDAEIKVISINNINE